MGGLFSAVRLLSAQPVVTMPRAPLGLLAFPVVRGAQARRRLRPFVLALCGLLTALGLAASAGDGLPHPLAWLAGLLPLQLAGLLWAVAHRA